MAGVFVSSWLGSLLLQVGEWIIKKLPLVKHIYSAAKQVSAAVNPANETTQSFRECVLIRHPRNGEFAFGFITGQTMLQASASAEQVCCTAALCPSLVLCLLLTVKQWEVTKSALVVGFKQVSAGSHSMSPSVCVHGSLSGASTYVEIVHALQL